MVLDCETTVDVPQDLNFLWWRFCEFKNGIYVCQLEGVVYADGLNKRLVKRIRKFVRGKRADVEETCPKEIRIQSRTEFVNGEFWDVLSAGVVIVCFNSPFDLSRLALAYKEARRKNTGWSMMLWKQKRKQNFKPKLRIRPKDSRSAFINLAGGDPTNRVIYRGRFLDLSVLGWALRNAHMTLNGFLHSFGRKGKMEYEPTGCITKKELKYGRKDVERTVALLNAMKCEYDGFALGLPPERAMSSASITKSFLDKMQIKQPADKYHLPDEIQGKCMQAYYGGRSEIRIRHTEMPIVVCDTTSEYPSVAGLLRLSPLLVAANINVVDCTEKARSVLRRVNPKTLLQPSIWKDLAFFALVKPHGEVLPVRSLYSKSGNTNIGVNPLTSDEPIWYAGPDLAAAKLFGTAPHVIKAFTLVPQGLQQGMKPTSLGSRQIDPAKDDVFLAIIEERNKLPEQHPHYLLLKIVANSLYGIFAELNKSEYGKNQAKKLNVFSGEHRFEQTTCAVETPGAWQFPPAAALITAGGRLILAILEQMVAEKGGSYLLTDTDSMLIVSSKDGGKIPCSRAGGESAVNAITWKQVEEICEELNQLNLYDRKVVDNILKIEKCNYDRADNQQQLYGVAVSAKRYVVYRRGVHKIEIIKPSEHGLGVVYVPDERKRYKPTHCKDQKTDYPRWIVEAWESLLERHFRDEKDPEDAMVSNRLWFAELPAIMRIRVTTPNVMTALRKRDRAAAKPYNFAQSPILIDPPSDCTLIAPSSKHPEQWLAREYTEVHSGKKLKLYDRYRGKQLKPQTLSNVIWRHFLHPEAKSLGPDGKPCGVDTKGLLERRPIQAMKPLRFIGKEIERKAREGEDISALESTGPIQYEPGRTAKTRGANPILILKAKRYGLRQLSRESGVHQHAIERFLKGKRVFSSTRVRIRKAVERLEQKEKTANPREH
jgi:hypothetical protein